MINKIIIPLLFIILLTGCSPRAFEERNYKVKIAVFYPTVIDTVTIEGTSTYYPKVSSHKGTNYISNIYSTTAPIKILSVE